MKSLGHIKKIEVQPDDLDLDTKEKVFNFIQNEIELRYDVIRMRECNAGVCRKGVIIDWEKEDKMVPIRSKPNLSLEKFELECAERLKNEIPLIEAILKTLK